MSAAATLTSGILSSASRVIENADGMTFLDGEKFYRITAPETLSPFLMSLISESDRWMFVSSTGGLTAGRIDTEHCLFPYETEDKLHCAAGITGPVTLLRAKAGDEPAQLWEPFRTPAAAHTQRALYKNLLGNKIVFEETHLQLGLTFRYCWSGSNAFGFVRTVSLINVGDHAALQVEWLDGVLNILPAGVLLAQQQQFSSLADAYKHSEIESSLGLGIFSLASYITDRAEPAECNRAAVAWYNGPTPATFVLDSEQIRAFRLGARLRTQRLLTGRRGNFLVNASARLERGERVGWQLVLDTDRSQAQVEELRALLQKPDELKSTLQESLESASDALRKIVSSADASQSTGSDLADAHHFANVLFNVMRGGVFAQNGAVPIADFEAFLIQRNKTVVEFHAQWLASLDRTVSYSGLLAACEKQNDADLLRLAYEYLPLTFSRRHGDPSRPWNKFAIHVRREDGSPVLNYQGNWRDIFQNWEALCFSYPAFIESIIAKFVNASTIDGHNPYRVTRQGIEWEVPDPHDPWSHIGYWGDHQIIYLQKLLEASQAFHPEALPRLLARDLFAYASVPYRLKPYSEICADPRNTIAYDTAWAERCRTRVNAIGSDGNLLSDKDGRVYHVTLSEKLLVTALSRVANLVVDGGIWMNTQRPEWNDANNALVGGGLSVVTLCHLRRYAAFCAQLFSAQGGVELSREVVQWLHHTHVVLESHRDLLLQPAIGDAQRRSILDALGEAFSSYRETVYENGFSGRERIQFENLAEFFRLVVKYLDHGIRANRREDGLYHGYNLLSLFEHARANEEATEREARVQPLYAMLEGQVAALSSGAVSCEDTLRLIDALFSSPLNRADQESFLLYPERALPGFLRKNVIAENDVKSNALLTALLNANNHALIECDCAGQYRFNSHFRNAQDVVSVLDRLEAEVTWRALAKSSRAGVLAIYEKVFHHAVFTGRSGAMYGYEGLGCIYWHMVAKLLLAVQEIFERAQREGASAETRSALAGAYYRVRKGLGFNKTAREYGAFPMDPYSHTPGHGGARQPGMTGQVKEEILTRRGELGLRVENGCLSFNPLLLSRSELHSESTAWTFHTLSGETETIELSPNTLGFTCCQVPVIYAAEGDVLEATVYFSDGRSKRFDAAQLDRATSALVFERKGLIQRVAVQIPAVNFLPL